ncbi:hypothetical protein ERL59_10300 [Chengkuizengella sp. YPA3-1-1]|uniref:Uncharacterized protein n=1 Tax=Chengkuizengella marina TaxID=2507566 RepID=A0A6N9Q3J4_9BACL|nr:hypothetical protein [Chengkuizengella marina]
MFNKRLNGVTLNLEVQSGNYIYKEAFRIQLEGDTHNMYKIFFYLVLLLALPFVFAAGIFPIIISLFFISLAILIVKIILKEK